MESQYTRRLEKIEAIIKIWLPEKPDRSWLGRVFEEGQTGALDLDLAATLTRPGWDLVNRGGKRWRPLLMTLTAESISGEGGFNALLPLTPLVELPHNASLIHDDIEDNSDERRGKPAVHLLYGTDTAINGGSFMYFLSLACLTAWVKGAHGPPPPPALALKVWDIWTSHMRAVHMGQAMDIAWHRDYLSLPGLDEYDRMCRLKTGCLARLAALLGVHCSGGEGNLDGLAARYGEAAEKLGVGFQILDDVKNLTQGNPGKKRGDDIVEGKKSLPVLLYLHRYPEKRDFAAACFATARAEGAAAKEVEELIGALDKAGVLNEAEQRGSQYIRESAETFSAPEIEGIPLKKEGRELLGGLLSTLG